MAERDLARLGGVCGLLFALLMVPAYVVGYPDAPTSTSSVEEMIAYFGEGPGAFVLANGVIPLFSAFFFVCFLGALHGLLRRAEGEGGALSSAALAGGTLFITLSCAGYAAEIPTRPASPGSRASRPTPSSPSRRWYSRRGCITSARSEPRSWRLLPRSWRSKAVYCPGGWLWSGSSWRSWLYCTPSCRCSELWRALCGWCWSRLSCSPGPVARLRPGASRASRVRAARCGPRRDERWGDADA